MAIWIQISSGSKEPVYKQIVDQIEQMVAMGQLQPGDKLPAVRQLAAELVVNPNTVAKAYTTLEQKELVITRKGAGTYINNPTSSSRDIQQINIINERLDNIISQAVNLGLSHKQITELFEQRLTKFKNGQNREGNSND